MMILAGREDYDAVVRLTLFASREIFLEAVRGWMTPFLAAVSITDFAEFNSSLMVFASLSFPRRLIFLTTPLMRVLTVRLRRRRF